MLISSPITKYKLSTHFKLCAAKALLAPLTLALLMSLSCGKRKPPLPPLERVLQHVEISGFQRGNQVILSWKMPAKNAPVGNFLHIDRADIYRLAEPLTAPQTLSEEEFASRSTLVATLSIRDSDFDSKTLSHTDTLQFAGQAARLRYAVRLVNGSGQKAGFSNFLLLEPTSRVAGSPTSLSAAVTQAAVNLTWTPPTSNVDGTTPVSLLGFNVYRSASEEVPAKLLNKTPVTGSSFDDEFFEFDKPLFYFVRAVSVGSGGEPVESGESNIVEILPRDTFPPSPPAAITLAATPSTISIFFATNPEKDVVGYRLYRSEDPTADKTQWQLLTPQSITTTTFQDSQVDGGKTYHYYVTALDKAGNVSEPSDVVSETVP
jgi:hypothetical protein